jgi:hypothetical protein
MNDNQRIVGFPEVDYTREPRRGFDLVQYGDDDPVLWPRCEITDCPNGICIGMSKSLCYPHGIEFGAFTEAEFEANRAERHGSDKS